MKYKIARISEHESTAGKLLDYRVLHLELWQYTDENGGGMSTIMIRNLECSNKEAQQYFDAYYLDKVLSLSLNTVEDNISK